MCECVCVRGRLCQPAAQDVKGALIWTPQKIKAAGRGSLHLKKKPVFDIN